MKSRWCFSCADQHFNSIQIHILSYICVSLYINRPIGLNRSGSLRIKAKEVKRSRQNPLKHQVDGWSLTWLGERNSWLLSLMYIFSPSNCGQTERRLEFDWSDSWDKGKSFAYHTKREKEQLSQSCQSVRDTKPHLDITELSHKTWLTYTFYFYTVLLMSKRNVWEMKEMFLLGMKQNKNRAAFDMMWKVGRGF